MYDDLETGGMSLLLINQVILIPSIIFILLSYAAASKWHVFYNVLKFLLMHLMVNSHDVVISSDINDSCLLISLKLHGITN